MTYIDHIGVHKPHNFDASIWRYLDFPKFMSLIMTRSLFFCRLPLLADQFEGSLPRLNLDQERSLSQQISEQTGVEPVNQMNSWRNSRLTFRDNTFLNCWHENERESAAMWDLYSLRGFGVALRSSPRRLIDSLSEYPPPFYLGRVNYVDYEIETIQRNSIFYPILTKRKSFEHEHEIRIFFCDWEKVARANETGEYISNDVTGVNVVTNLPTLIEKVFVSPSAPKWFADVVRSVMKTVGLEDIEIVQSALDSEPIY